MRILNLYCGIGGNRKLWPEGHEITAVENDPDIAKIYQDFFPNDKVIVADAHQYLLDHFKEFDFIWSSPPCQSHSVVRFIAMNRIKRPQKPIFPDMKLYEEIIFLQNYYKGNYTVENVKGYYEPLVKPQVISKHYIWANFFINSLPSKSREHRSSIEVLEKRKGFNLKDIKIAKRKVLRNCVEPELGLHIFLEANREYKTLL